VGDGVVTRIGVGDRAAGNYVFLRHANGYETGYLHLSRFAGGLKVGQKVAQKQVIATPATPACPPGRTCTTRSSAGATS
jgi:murein DD-endopeptidase MepM/ murein hydrolase activator NlpD